MSIKTPVLLITFARPEYAAKSFAAIRNAKPPTLYLYNNAPRSTNKDEVLRNSQVRQILNNVDWECDLKTFYRDEHVDVYTSIYSAIDWIFDNEEQAIIIEEDCVASLAFFDYCEKLLSIYKNEKKVWMLTGDNFTPEGNPPDMPYFFTRYGHIYGWASWSDRWNNQDRKLSGLGDLIKSKHFYTYFGDERRGKYFEKMFVKFYKKLGKYNPWDFIKSYNMIASSTYAIIPSINLVSNIGVSGQHNKNIKPSKNHNLPIPTFSEFKFDKLLSEIEPTTYDDYHFQHHYWLRRVSLPSRVFNKILRILKLT